ncbi:MAG: TIM barrel protein [Planctomycetaceae bacterium]
MSFPLSRRRFLGTASLATAAVALPRSAFALADEPAPFKISLAEWSLHRTIRNEKKLTNLDFARVAKEEFGIEAIEYVNQFFADKAKDMNYLRDLKQRADDHGVKNLLIMVDGEGNLGDPRDEARTKTVENHKQWVDAAKFLGCHSIRVNAGSKGTFEEQQKLAADGLRKLSEYAATQSMNVIVENHGGLSSDGSWLAGVMKLVAMDNCGTLPDFGNFYIERGDNPKLYDRYKGVDELMPFAKAVSAKTYDFDDEGNETTIDYPKMMAIVLSHGYHGYVGIEYEGSRLSEYEGIRKSKALLEKCMASVAVPASK